MYKISLIIFISVIAGGLSAEFPGYIEKCAKNDATINDCIKINGAKAIPHILNGDKVFKIPKLVPLKIPEASIKSANLDTKYKNIVITGLETARIEDVNANLNDHKVSITIAFDFANVTADYEIKGRILLFTLDGKGKAQLNSIGQKYKCSFDYTLHEKNGKEYMKLGTFSCESDTKRIYYHLDNILGGNKLLEDELNKTLNENWQTVRDEIGPGFREILHRTIEQIFRNVFEQFSYDQIFL